MAFRILSLLLCLLLAGPVSASAHAAARPETRVGKIFSDSLKSAPADLDQTLDTRRESRGCGYDFASGVCKYLYAHGNPVMMVDPSGHDGNSISTLTAVGIALNIAFLAADSVSLAKNHASGNQRGAAVDSVNVAVDIALLAVPFSGAGGAAARSSAGVIQMAAASARSAATNIRLAWAGIRSIVMFAQATGDSFDGSGSSGSSSGSGTSSGGEPGSWQKVNESMPDRARAYQAGITGRGANEVYVVNGVKFDGYNAGKLIEAKGPGYGAFVGKNGRFYDWFDGAEALVSQARRQVSASGGKAIEWHVAEPEAANAIRTLLQQNGQGAINVINTVVH